MKGFEQYADFPEKLNALGLEAVKAKGTPEYPFCLRRLWDYFIKGFEIHLYLKNGITEKQYEKYIWEIDKKNQSKANKKIDRIQAVIEEWTQKNETGEFAFVNRLRGKVERFDPDVPSEEELPFYAYVIKDYYIESERHYERAIARECRKGIKIPDAQDRMLKKISAVWEKQERSTTEQEIQKCAEVTGYTKEQVKEALKLRNAVSFIPLDERTDEEDEDSECIEDFIPSNDSINIYLSDDHDALLILLEKINDVCRKSFSENNKLCFSWGLTNRLIINDIRLLHYGTIQKTIDDRWNDFGVEEQKENYADGRYLCVSRELIEWFEAVRKELFDKDIAEHLGMKAPFFCKHFKQANDAVISHLNKLYKNS